jgi:Ca2+-binding EF-hand superfamily protein
MLSEFRKEKVIRLFEFYDINENGYIEDGDIVEICEAFAAEFEWEIHDEPYISFKRQFQNIWLKLVLAADTNYDGKITLPEFLASYSVAIANDDTFQQYIMPFWSMIYELLDPYDTNFIARDNYMKFYRAFRNSSKAAQKAFVAMDLNGDGYLSKPELYQNFYNFYMSDDENDISKLFFGMWIK